MHPSSTFLSGHQSYMLQGCSPCGLCGSSCCGRLTTVGSLVGMAGWSGWLPGRALYGSCQLLVGRAGS